MVRAASTKSPSLTWAMKAGISTLTGHPSMHLGFLQERQRAASAMASSRSKP